MIRHHFYILQALHNLIASVCSWVSLKKLRKFERSRAELFGPSFVSNNDYRGHNTRCLVDGLSATARRPDRFSFFFCRRRRRSRSWRTAASAPLPRAARDVPVYAVSTLESATCAGNPYINASTTAATTPISVSLAADHPSDGYARGPDAYVISRVGFEPLSNRLHFNTHRRICHGLPFTPAIARTSVQAVPASTTAAIAAANLSTTGMCGPFLMPIESIDKFFHLRLRSLMCKPPLSWIARLLQIPLAISPSHSMVYLPQVRYRNTWT